MCRPRPAYAGKSRTRPRALTASWQTRQPSSYPGAEPGPSPARCHTTHRSNGNVASAAETSPDGDRKVNPASRAHSFRTASVALSAKSAGSPSSITANTRLGSPADDAAEPGSTGSPPAAPIPDSAAWHNRDTIRLAVHRSAVRRDAAMNSWTPPRERTG